MKAEAISVLLFLAVCCGATNASASCKPDFASQDKISKQPIVRWMRNLTEVGFWKSMVVTDIDVIAVIGRYGDANALNIQIVNKENDRDRAAFDSRYRAATGDSFVFGFKDAEPMTFVATSVNNQAQIQEAKGLVMTVILSAQVTDAELARFRTALTTKQIDAVRIGLSSGMIERSIAEELGEAMRQKFSCFYDYLDGHGIKLPASADRASSTSLGGSDAESQQLDPVVEDILAQDKLTLQAMVRHDMAYLDRHIANDGVFTSGGKQLTKRMLIAQIMEQQSPPKPVKSRYSAVTSTTTGDVVELTCTATLSIQSTGGWRDFYEVRGTTKYRKIEGEWVMLSGTNEYEKPLK